MSLNVDRCMREITNEGSAKPAGLTLELTLFLHFIPSTCNLLICPIFTHEQLYCPLWATVVTLRHSRFLILRCILGEKNKTRFSRQQQPWAAEKRQHSALSSGVTCRVTEFTQKHCINRKEQGKKSSTIKQEWSGGGNGINLKYKDGQCCAISSFHFDQSYLLLYYDSY